VVLGDDVKIYPNCFIGDVVIGDNVTILLGLKIYDNGNNCAIHSTSYRSRWFWLCASPDGTLKNPQIECIIEDNVDIGACTTIDRATNGVYNYKKRN
jgi:UDP-3-O-[3-hydroxymyristoyl] glucosamine N-acyltransferase